MNQIDLGRWLNTVTYRRHTLCGAASATVDIHVNGVWWRCCHTAWPLPKLHPGDGSPDTCARCRGEAR